MSPFKADFPLLRAQDIAYFDSAATTLKPQVVIDSVCRFYQEHTANVGRGNHRFAELSSKLVGDARETVALHLGVGADSIAFSKNATEAISWVAHGLDLGPDSNVIVSDLEHAANMLPWQSRQGLQIRYAPLDSDGRIDLERLGQLIDADTRLISVSALSNVSGIEQPVEDIVRLASRHGILTLVDASQLLGHKKISAERLGCDFLVFSGHKLFSPSGVGCLYARDPALLVRAPVVLGGGAFEALSKAGHRLKPYPFCYEAGTPNIEGIIGLGAGIAYLGRSLHRGMGSYLAGLSGYLFEQLATLPFIVPLARGGQAPGPIQSFSIRSGPVSAEFVSRYLSDNYGIFVRAGQHCCQIYHDSLGLAGSIRVSLQCYNDRSDIDRLIAALREMALTFNFNEECRRG
jgi:cysteine desulfurase/selenocysteine lyase